MKPALATTADAPVAGLKRHDLTFVVPALSRFWAVMSTLTAVVGSAKQSECGTKSRYQTATVRTVADIADGQRGSSWKPWSKEKILMLELYAGLSDEARLYALGLLANVPRLERNPDILADRHPGQGRAGAL